MKSLILVLMLVSVSASAQTIAITPLSRTIYCQGDTLVLVYTTTGTFAGDNIFLAQRSGVNDSFKTFTNVGTDNSHRGYFQIKLNPADSPFVFRVISTDPATVSNYAGSNIKVSAYPSPDPAASSYPYRDYRITTSVKAMVGDSVRVRDAFAEPVGSAYHWTFGQDASLHHSDSSVAFVIYPKAGKKYDTLSVTNPSGCSLTATDSFTILSCDPAIPRSVHIVTGTESGSYPNVWVKPGGNFTASGGTSDTANIFVENGASIVLNVFREGRIYVKSGASFSDISYPNESFGAIVLPREIVVKNLGDHLDTFYCDNLRFDTSDFHSSVRSIASNVQLKQRGDIVEVSGLEGETRSIIIYDILGTEIAHAYNLHVPLATFNTRPFESGAYFVRVETSEGLKTWRFQIVR